MLEERLVEAALRVLAAVSVHCEAPTPDDEQFLRAHTGNSELPIDELARHIVEQKAWGRNQLPGERTFTQRSFQADRASD